MKRQNDPTEYIYECIFSCRPKNLALEEVLSYWPTYEANLEALKVAGSISLANDDAKNAVKKQHDFHELKNSEIDIMNLIAHNKKKVIVKHKSAEKVINDVSDQIHKQTGIIPKQTLIMINEGGIKVYGFVIDNQIVSNIGYFLDDKTSQLKLIKIT